MVLRISPEKREERARVRMSLLRAALHLGAEHGFSSLGLREVARAASIAPTSFYRHFSEMPELGQALVEELVRPLLAQLAARVRAAQARALAPILVDGLFAAVDADAELVRFVVAERFGAFAPLRASLSAELELVAKLVQRALKERSIVGGVQRRLPTVVALLLDGLGRALDVAPARRASLREQLVASLAFALDESVPEENSP